MSGGATLRVFSFFLASSLTATRSEQQEACLVAIAVLRFETPGPGRRHVGDGVVRIQVRGASKCRTPARSEDRRPKWADQGRHSSVIAFGGARMPLSASATAQRPAGTGFDPSGAIYLKTTSETMYLVAIPAIDLILTQAPTVGIV